jgi:hypothetical protein
MSITIDDVKDQLLSLDTVREQLGSTEPLNTYEFEVGANQVAFKLPEGFNHGLKGTPEDTALEAFVTISGTELRLTPDSLYQLAGEAYMSKGFVQNNPAEIIEDVFNHQFNSGLHGKDFKILAVGDRKAAAITRGALQPYSNLQLLEIALNEIEKQYGAGEVWADYKFVHNLKQTHLRLIIPEHMRVMQNTGTDNDTWSAGIQLINSLNGDEQTQINSYLFRYWCTNGAIDTTHSSNSVWSRRGAAGKSDAVYEWAKDAVDEALSGLEGAFDSVQALTNVSIEGSAAEALEGVFNIHKIPRAQREAITRNMVNEDEMTMYSLMQAVTQAANAADVKPHIVNSLMHVGGDIPRLSAAGRCDNCHQFLGNHDH